MRLGQAGRGNIGGGSPARGDPLAQAFPIAGLPGRQRQPGRGRGRGQISLFAGKRVAGQLAIRKEIAFPQPHGGAHIGLRPHQHLHGAVLAAFGQGGAQGGHGQTATQDRLLARLPGQGFIGIAIVERLVEGDVDHPILRLGGQHLRAIGKQRAAAALMRAVQQRRHQRLFAAFIGHHGQFARFLPQQGGIAIAEIQRGSLLTRGPGLRLGGQGRLPLGRALLQGGGRQFAAACQQQAQAGKQRQQAHFLCFHGHFLAPGSAPTHQPRSLVTARSSASRLLFQGLSALR